MFIGIQVPLVQPFIRPTLQLVESSPYNVTYTVNISETDLFRVHNTTGSGDITKGATPVTFIFQIKTNSTYHYIVQVHYTVLTLLKGFSVMHMFCFSQDYPKQSRFFADLSVKKLKYDMLLSIVMASLAIHHHSVYIYKEAS